MLTMRWEKFSYGERLQAEQEKGCEMKYLNMVERISLHEIYTCFLFRNARGWKFFSLS